MVCEHVVPAPRVRHVKLVFVRAPGEFEDVAAVGRRSEDCALRVAAVPESALHILLPAYGFQRVVITRVSAGVVLIIKGVLSQLVKAHNNFCDFARVGTWTAPTAGAWVAPTIYEACKVASLVDAVRLRVAATHPTAIAGRASPGASQTCICIWKAITRSPGRTVSRIEGRVALPGATNEQLVRVGEGGRVLPSRRGGKRSGASCGTSDEGVWGNRAASSVLRGRSDQMWGGQGTRAGSARKTWQ